MENAEGIKSVAEILAQAAKDLRDCGHGSVSTPLFWDCECEFDFMQDGWREECPICGAVKYDQPDSMLNEVLDVMASHYVTSPTDGVCG